VRFIKSNLNLNLTGNLSRIPALTNGALTYSLNNMYRFSMVLSSNISEKVDFTLSSSSSYNRAWSTLGNNQLNQYYNQNSRAMFRLIFWKSLIFETGLTHQYYTGLTGDYNQNYTLLNGGLGKKLFKNDLGELKFSVFDILKQNSNIDRNVTDLYIEDSRSLVLQRYYMFTFTYNLRRFKEQAPELLPGRNFFPANTPNRNFPRQ
jgi:hypothetical protein